jgi:hypothetical protein
MHKLPSTPMTTSETDSWDFKYSESILFHLTVPRRTPVTIQQCLSSEPSFTIVNRGDGLETH